MRYHQILTETQIANMGAIEQWLSSVSDYNKPWFVAKGKRYLATKYHGPALRKVQAGRADPPWIQKLVAQGQEVFTFDPLADSKLTDDMHNIADWINHLYTNDRNAYKKLDLYNFEQADAAQKKWHASLAKRALKQQEIEQETGAVTVMQIGDYRWVVLTDPDTLTKEGDRMGHCVGSYWRYVRSGEIKIYSLRDARNNPHVTMEVKMRENGYGNYTGQGTVIQVQGRANTVPNLRYIEMIFAFASKMNFDWNHRVPEKLHKEIEKAGLRMFSGKLMTSDQYRQVLEDEIKLGDDSREGKNFHEPGANIYGAIDNYVELLQQQFGMDMRQSVERVRSILPKTATRVYSRFLAQHLPQMDKIIYIMRDNDGTVFFWDVEHNTIGEIDRKEIRNFVARELAAA